MRVLLLLGLMSLALIARAINVLVLLFARSAADGFEIAVRSAIGASWQRLFGQLSIETTRRRDLDLPAQLPEVLPAEQSQDDFALPSCTPSLGAIHLALLQHLASVSLDPFSVSQSGVSLKNRVLYTLTQKAAVREHRANLLDQLGIRERRLGPRFCVGCGPVALGVWHAYTLERFTHQTEQIRASGYGLPVAGLTRSRTS